MLGLFKSKKQKLEDRYRQLLNESHRWSILDREKSAIKQAEAQRVKLSILRIDQE
ncbi:MAG: Lacal_2735 family protein [Reichenbachiella sp.]|uniref:Lacal_2735 family protein n=1 Tax=Reichenbachiella sp. TaxID=2184521 RepID=UPI003265B36A